MRAGPWFPPWPERGPVATRSLLSQFLGFHALKSLEREREKRGEGRGESAAILTRGLTCCRIPSWWCLCQPP